MSWNEIYTSLPILDALARALLLFLVQGAVLAMGLAALLAVIPVRFARGRYALACVVLVAMAICPVVTTWSLLRAQERPQEPGAIAASEPGLRWQTTDSSGPWAVAPSPAFRPDIADVAAPTPRATNSWEDNLYFQPTIRAWSERIQPWLPAVVTLWFLGVVGLSCAHLGAWRRLQRLRLESHPADADWQLIMTRLVRRTGLAKAVDLLVSHRISVPMVVGWFRPVVLVPASAMVGLSPQQLESLVVHELAHIRRLDPWVNGLQVILETLLFYHPAVWWTSAQVRHLREHCCDDIAVRVCGDRLTYLRALADLEGLRATVPGSPRLALGADGGSLLARVRRLADPGAGAETMYHRAASSGLVAVLTTALLAVLSLTTLAQVVPPEVPEARPVQPPTPPEPVVEPPAPHPVIPAVASRPPRPPIPTPEIAVPPAPPIPSPGRMAAGPDASGRYSVGQLIAFKVHGIERVIAELEGTRFASLPPEELLPLAVHDLDRQWIESWDSVGFGELGVEDLVFLASHDVSPESVQELRRAGLEITRPADLVQASIHDLRPEVIEELRGAGLGDLDLQGLLPLAIHGIDGEQIQRYRNAGVRIESPDDIVVLVVSGVDPALPRALRDLGLDDLEARELAELSHLGLDTDKLAELRAGGLESPTLQELRRLVFRSRHHPGSF